MITKICGITTKETAQVVEASGAQFIGFVFAPSRRKISPGKAKEIADSLSSAIQKVGVFVNESRENIIEIARKVGLDYIQLHGSESAEFAKSIPYPIIKAFSIDNLNPNTVGQYPCEYLLIDSPGEEYEGGSGKVFNWDRLKNLNINKRKLILAGGLSSENINEAIQSVKPTGVDVSSGVETNGIKNHEKIKRFVLNVNEATEQIRKVDKQLTTYTMPNKKGRYGNFGGRFVPELLMPALLELEKAYEEAKQDEQFKNELNYYLTEYVGRETPLYEAKNFASHLGKARIFLKREDLNHTGAHKINNSIGQALLAKRMGKKKIVAETGAGQHGVATATVCALLDLECIVFMGEADIKRQALNVFRMELLGATVKSVAQGSGTLKDAVNEALRYWVSNVEDTHYILGSVVGPHPFPMIVRDFQSVIGNETKQQITEQTNELPDHIIAAVGGGSNAMGMFYPFIEDAEVKLYGIEAGGLGINSTKHAATLTSGETGVLHGTMTKLLQSESGQIEEAFSISAGLDYPGVGPEHSHLAETERVTYDSITDKEALEAFQILSKKEGIIPALESAHAVAYAMKLAKQVDKDETIVICLSGRGDKDVQQVKERLEAELNG